MPYSVIKSNPSNGTITIPDVVGNEVDTSLKLIGRNDPNYGQAIAENFVHLLENFSADTAPASPIQGQIWYDTQSYKLRTFDGLLWKPVNVVYQSTNTSVTATTVGVELGDILVYTNPSDSEDNKIQLWNGTEWKEPANVPLTSLSITGNPEISTASSSAKLIISDSGVLYSIEKEDFLADSVTPNLVQPGMVLLWTSASEPSGWLLCDGRSVSTTTYSTLFSAINIQYGIGDIPNTFKIPNITGPVSTGSGVTLNYIIKT